MCLWWKQKWFSIFCFPLFSGIADCFPPNKEKSFLWRQLNFLWNQLNDGTSTKYKSRQCLLVLGLLNVLIPSVLPKFTAAMSSPGGKKRIQSEWMPIESSSFGILLFTSCTFVKCWLNSDLCLFWLAKNAGWKVSFCIGLLIGQKRWNKRVFTYFDWPKTQNQKWKFARNKSVHRPRPLDGSWFKTEFLRKSTQSQRKVSWKVQFTTLEKTHN